MKTALAMANPNWNPDVRSVMARIRMAFEAARRLR